MLKNSKCSINVSFHKYSEFSGNTRKADPQHQGLDYPITGFGVYIVRNGEKLEGFVIRILLKLI